MFTSVLKSFALVGVLLASSFAQQESKTTVKRGIPDFGFSSYAGGFNGISGHSDVGFSFPSVPIFVKPAPVFTPGLTIQKHLVPYHPPISSADIATAIAAAKEASARVQYLQSRVHAAKESLVEQQRLASAKEQAAQLALQRSEAAAAVQRQAASAAASSVVHAQQRLAEAKAEVAEQQRIAAAKESLAAHVIQKSANAAAAEIQRTEHTAEKIAALQRSEAQAAIHHVTSTKDASLSATASAVAAAAAAHPQHPYPQPPPGKYHPWN